jgi:aryl-alcohol dehydrogenase-like predicted oxidoreductase
VEEIYGTLRARILAERGVEAERSLRVHTKLVPDLSVLRTIERRDIEAIVDRSLRRLKTERLDLVQFHWWDYSESRWLDAFGWLDQLRAKGKVRLIGATNFDAAHARAILEAGIPLVSMQVQYSVLDRRPEKGLSQLCQAHGVGLICYGSVAGGFLSDRWLGRPAPLGPLENRSLVKYKLIIEDFGGWSLFQELLRTLRRVADSHDSDIASVASRFTLDLKGVVAVIIGATSRAHLAVNAGMSALKLTDADRGEVEAVGARRHGPSGDVYELERDRNGRHGSIMKYNLNMELV